MTEFSIFVTIVLSYLVPFFLIFFAPKIPNNHFHPMVIGGYIVTSLTSVLVFLGGFFAFLYDSEGNLNLHSYYNFLFTSLCIFFPKFIFAITYYFRCSYACKKFLKNQSLDNTKIDIEFRKANYNNQFIFVILILLIISWLLISDFRAVTDSRFAYQYDRKGWGYVWALMVSMSVIFYTSDMLKKRRVSLFNTIFFLIICYLSGSKQILIATIILAPFLPFISKGTRKKLFVVSGLLGVLTFVYLFSNFAGDSFFLKVQKYLNVYSLSDRVFEDYVNGNLEYKLGEIFLSGFWYYVPRIIFESKPFAYGATYLVEIYFPGSAETGHTPSFGYAHLFYDFGWFGFILTIFSFRTILYLFAAFVITSPKKIKAKILLIPFLFFPFYAFHVPLQYILLFHWLLLNLRLPKFVIKL